LAKPGDLASLRFSFAFFEGFERYRDISPAMIHYGKIAALRIGMAEFDTAGRR
jgi:hypothetical protein